MLWQQNLSRGVLTCGWLHAGTTMFPGINDRMQKEVTSRAPASMKVKVSCTTFLSLGYTGCDCWRCAGHMRQQLILACLMLACNARPGTKQLWHHLHGSE